MCYHWLQEKSIIYITIQRNVLWKKHWWISGQSRPEIMQRLRHRGQELQLETHLAIQIAWKTWPHVTCLPGNSEPKPSMHTVQTPADETVCKFDVKKLMFDSVIWWLESSDNSGDKVFAAVMVKASSRSKIWWIGLLRRILGAEYWVAIERKRRRTQRRERWEGSMEIKIVRLSGFL